MDDVYLRESGDRFEVAGSGRMPLEHKTYLYFVFPFLVVDPVFDSARYIHIECRTADENGMPLAGRIALVLEKDGRSPSKRELSLYEAEVPLYVRLEADKLRIDLDDVELQSHHRTREALRVSGCIVAKRSGAFDDEQKLFASVREYADKGAQHEPSN